jgi:hypothetical protein
MTETNENKIDYLHQEGRCLQAFSVAIEVVVTGVGIAVFEYGISRVLGVSKVGQDVPN